MDKIEELTWKVKEAEMNASKCREALQFLEDAQGLYYALFDTEVQTYGRLQMAILDWQDKAVAYEAEIKKLQAQGND